jgi:hypothetical protein
MKVLELCKDRESYVLIFAPDDKLSFRNHVNLVSRLICCAQRSCFRSRWGSENHTVLYFLDRGSSLLLC